MEIQKTSNSQSNLEKEQTWNEAVWLQTILQSYSHQERMVLAQRQKYRLMEQDRKTRDKSTHLWALWRRQWHPTPVLLPGKSHGWRSLVGCSPWGRQESDRTERLHCHFPLSTFMHWRRKWQPTPVFLPGESQGRGSLVGCRLWGGTESDTTEVT